MVVLQLKTKLIINQIHDGRFMYHNLINSL